MPDLFANAARGLFQLITELESIREVVERRIGAQAPDQDALLVAWLNELVYLFDTKHLLFRRFQIVQCSRTNIRAKAYGEPVDPKRHEIKTGVKSATYHGLAIRKGKNGYTARIIFDV